jgi:16S rRNA (adenine1518-N6/adenine1519-N6)-dimethyltransferase
VRRGRKALGQHWLVDRRVLGRIARAARIAPDDTVIEVGPGTGLLTDLLAEKASRVIAVEIDGALAAGMRARFAERPQVAVIEGDVLALSPEEVLAAGGGRLPYVVVGNFPYAIGSAIVRHFLTARAQPRWIVATLQSEVARNIAAAPGEMSYLSAETQYYAEPRLLFEVPARAFRPPPKVRSAVVRLETRRGTAVEVDDREAFLEFVRAGFAAPRKQLRNALATGLRCPPAEAERALAEACLDPTRRAQTLTLQEWAALYSAHRGSTMAVRG